jgi:hypothetical protein
MGWPADKVAGGDCPILITQGGIRQSDGTPVRFYHERWSGNIAHCPPTAPAVQVIGGILNQSR